MRMRRGEPVKRVGPRSYGKHLDFKHRTVVKDKFLRQTDSEYMLTFTNLLVRERANYERVG